MNRFFYTVLIALTTISTFWACDNEDPWSPYQSKATISHSSKGWDETTITLKTSGDVRYTWEAVIVEGYEWASFSSQSEVIATTGKVGGSATIYFDKNETTESRSASVYIKFSDGYNTTLSFVQLGKSDNATYDRAWGEQPVESSAPNLVHKTYYTTLSNGKAVRNYSICYDTEKLVSRWVAYPLHSIYTDGRGYPGGGRTDAWAFDDAITEYYNGGYRIVEYEYTDPVIPQSKQQNIVEGAYGTGDSRGHMLPSASRYSTWMTNAQTFYATNMMPQDSRFNSGVWATVENGARKMVCADTLYVVVGTLFENAKTFTARGRTITRPTHCYKLLLRTRSGNTGKSIDQITNADDIKAIGFLFENESTASDYKSAAVSIKEIESRTGFTFFRNLNPAIAAEVKSQKNVSDWNF
ncbi:MAG: DNA/RNA non-specific endonuclease [Alistipes sp.]|nr:DNA/RNA non-specific endonuclease [Alistipes sp.]